MLPSFLKPYNVKTENLIRIGPKSDGGYIVHKDSINLTKKIITCGLNDDWKFEKNFTKLNNHCFVEAYDHTIDKDFWYQRFKKDIIHFFLLKKLRLSKIIKMFDYIDYKIFFKKKNIHFLKKVVRNSKKEDEISLTNIIDNFEDIFLKIDIEGNEYEILPEVTKHSEKIISLIVEFHDIDSNLDKIEKFIIENKFLKLIHIHANNYKDINTNGNPNDIELTFVNKNKINISNERSQKSYPIHGLDYKNLKRKKDIELKFNE
tara:strand:- start:1133 stop:1915 length:783 start_codon:yes stop_codon:yes gene_type:complete